jgi:CheY-like chemotaxis protein/signal transduction histidine kinase
MKTGTFLFLPLSFFIFFIPEVKASDLSLLRSAYRLALSSSNNHRQVQENAVGEANANDAGLHNDRYESNYVAALLWKAFWLKVFIAVLALSVVLLLFYLRLNALKRHCIFLEEDVARQTEGLRSANSILIHKHDEIYKQVSRVIAQQEQILKQNFQLEYRAESLRKLSISKDHLIATLINDLENPVISLSEIAESLKEALPRLSKSEMSSFFKIIHSCSADIHLTLTNLINWNQLQNKDITYRPSDFCIGDVIKDNVVLITKQLTQKEFKIDFQVDDHHKIVADFEMMNAVFRNILTNCIKISSDGIVTIKSAATEKQIIVSMICATNQETIDHCTNILQDNSHFTNIRFGGSLSSLALTIVKEFARINNGRVSIERRGDKILTLNIQLPKSIKEVDLGLIVHDHEISPEKIKDFVKSDDVCVLIVDERAEVRDCLKRIFEPVFKVIEASSGKEGLEMAIRYKPSVILAEVALPDMDGFQLCRAVKRTASTNQIPFVFLTNEWTEECKHQGHLAGASEYITKPISKDLLLQNVYQILEEQRKAEQQVLGNAEIIRDEISHSKTDQEFLNKVLVVIDENLSDPDFDYRKVCEQMAMSKSVLYVKFKSITGQGVQEFIKSVRLKKSISLLLAGNMSINEIAIEVGFNSQSYYNKCFLKQYGVGPKEYARKNRNTAVANIL